MDKNGAIGKDGKLPWHIPSELKHFRDTTMGHTVIMGLNTYNETKKLPRRHNIVLVDYDRLRKEGVYASYYANYLKNNGNDLSFFEIKELKNIKLYNENWVRKSKAMFIIGGGSIFKQALPFADKMILSVIDTKVEGADAFFPEWNKKEWFLEKEHSVNNNNEIPYKIQTWLRVQNAV